MIRDTMALQEISQCGDGWFNLCTMISQVFSLTRPDPSDSSQVHTHSTSGQQAKLGFGEYGV